MKNSKSISAFHLNHLNPKRITYARELRGLTKKSLAEKINKSPAAVTQFEAGLKPDVTTLACIADVLRLPLSFFSVDDTGIVQPSIEEFHFRARASVTQAMKYRSRRYAELVMDIFRFLSDYGVVFPKENISSVQRNIVDGMKVSDVAAMVRTEWGLLKRPIHDLFPLLEKNGIFIVLLDQDYNDLEACATWFDNRPCIMLAYKKFINSASRLHFDLSHELGHLFLHDESSRETAKESQAHEFAASFLMPQDSFSMDSPRKWHLGMFLELKRKWRVSLQAALRRSRDLSLITESSYRWGMVDISKRGYRQQEPAEFDVGRPSLLSQAVELVKEQLTLDEFADGVHIHPDELADILDFQRVDPNTIHEMKRPLVKHKSRIVTFKPKVNS